MGPVARHIRVAPMSDHAEVAIEIVDQYQSNGGWLGSH